MRVVGYVRQPADESRPAFAQQEELRRHASAHGHRLVAICQDTDPSERDGYVSLLGVVAAGGVDAVLVPGVETLSSDQIVQEIMLWDLKERGIPVVSTRSEDLPLLDPRQAPEAGRMLIRDVLGRVGEHTRALGSRGIDAPGNLPNGDVVIHIVEPDEQDGAVPPRAEADSD